MEKHNPLFDRIALIVFAKTLDVPVKTRIARTEGKAAADRIYRELLDRTAAAIADIPYHVAFAGNQSPGMLATIFGRAVSFFLQHGDDLGIRMKNASLHCMEQGYAGSIVIGCDCPLRTAEDILAAAEQVKNGDNVVLGPVSDGGYSLAGVDSCGLAIFDATKWSTAELMEETLEIIRSRGLKSSLLPVLDDIDTIEDYRKWKNLF